MHRSNTVSSRGSRTLLLKAVVCPVMLAAAAPFSVSGQSSEEDETQEVVELPAFVASADASAEGLLSAYPGGQVATGGRVGILGPLDYMETPFTLTSYTQELIEDQQAESVGDVLLNDPAVRVARGFGNFQQVYMIRGLPVFSDDLSYNGLYGLLPRQYLATEFVERVEVLRGANAFLNGAAPGGSGLGGAVNIVPKRAGKEPLTELRTGVQSGGQAYLATDIARRFQEERFGVRLNAARHDGDTAIDGESMELDLFSLGMDFQEENFRLSADIGYQDFQRDASQPNITIGAGNPIPSAPDASTSVAQPWTFSDERDYFGTVRGEFDLTDNIIAWAAIGGREGTEENRLANPTVDANGDGTAYRFDNVREDSVVTGEIGLRTFLDAGSSSHEITVSATALDFDSENAYAMSDFTGFPFDIYDPATVSPPPANAFVGGDLDNPRRTEESRTTSLAIGDLASFLEDRLILLAGVRYQTIKAYSYDYNTGARTSGYSESDITPVGGILFRFTPVISTYISYVEGLTKGDIAPATNSGGAVVNAGEALDPYVTEQIEVGTKLDFGRFGGTVAIFESRKPEAGVDNNQVFGEIGEQKTQGLEVSAFGEPMDGFRLLGGVSFLDAEIEGNDAIGVPDFLVNLTSEYDIPWVSGLTADGRYIYTSSQYANSANTQKVPSWQRFDLGLRYQFELYNDVTTILRARIENVADEDYWASAGGFPGAGYLTVGDPRTFMVSATFNF